ncbi:DUF5071 domain-containing protein [Bacillus massilinigeriensis]|uniref:DUF5071 domain-containing protein n=1 Tax=Bacillus massilionigeriensis TaxID=1805475 RepID=UPI000A041103|nr:DUF5071 domain-containing protein [Bacillus massilionigeriensis]
MNICDEYSPRNKHDFEKVSKLKKVEQTELWSLMGWVHDMNWPIAEEWEGYYECFRMKLFH